MKDMFARLLLALTWAFRLVSAAEVGLALENGVPFPFSDAWAGHRLTLERSADLVTWHELAVVRERLRPYGDWSATGHEQTFYRVAASALAAADDWSNQLAPTTGELFTPAAGSGLAAIRFAKFTLVLSEPGRVYFQDTAKWPYHYPFARARLPGYAGMTVLEYNAQSLVPGPNQRLVLGSVLRAPDPQVREVGIEITGTEAFPVAATVDWVEAVQRRLALDEGWRVFYLPSVEQRAAAEAGRALFEARGIPLDSISRWASGSACYAAGWALGKLVFVPGPEISAALGDGRLGFGDILVTDRVPSELPVLAGYLSLEPATPNSHVALLAQSLLLPFAYAHGGGWQAEIASLNGREVLLVIDEADGNCRITLTDTTGRLTPEQRQEILDRNRSGPLEITPKAPAGVLHLGVDTLTPADLRHVGGKAANFGFLRRSLPDASPSPAIAFTFDLWDAYLDQPLPGGGTLRERITARLGTHRFPPAVSLLRADLAAIRELITGTADFNPAQRTAIVAALQQAGLGGRNIRFRSSTNVEDSDTFSGAGLYDSYSGCLEDDLDGDSRGPSHCDPTESNERGVVRAMRKVYASFYNENAFLERLRYGLDESTVGMALLVHFSSPDADELANGVATVAIQKTGETRRATVRLVTQLGAESVSNPDPAKRPEIVTTSYEGGDASAAVLTLVEASSLTSGGAPVMPWEDDYRVLLHQLNTATLAYEAYYPTRTAFELDFEYKRLRPGAVGLKQIRAVPHPVPVPPPTIP